ncbi:FKBP-type peptidyl-prolyl cis-trans isomerase [Demetria terragena]|uniref:FKBP-type peptidyl-prolyl cis-trans isomerase n=1 Tax=Demetria terragena TaxID=63959 RepID=UPI0003A41D2E|nr:FKBP-type peptidyl-prolyl cis-trans isomerase [Demetria terragena]
MRSPGMRFAAAAALVPLTFLAACGDDSEQKANSSSAKPTTAASPHTVAKSKVAPISDATVSTADPAKPKLTVKDAPFQVNETTTKVTKKGTGKKVGNKDIAYVSYVAVNGTSGKTIESTFGKPNASFNLGNPGTFPGLVDSLKGKKVGTEMVVAVPPADGFGTKGNKQVGVKAKDTLVFYVKINDSMPILTKLTGKQAPSEPGLPTVTMPSSYAKPAKITVPKGSKPPAKLRSQVLIKGEGPKVVAGQQMLVQYTGQIWGGKMFDSTGAVPGQPPNPQKTPGQPTPMQIGAGKVIPGWDKTLVGQTVGSRVLMSIPPADGYGKKGNPQGGIKGTDTLVFVVDILAAL